MPDTDRSLLVPFDDLETVVNLLGGWERARPHLRGWMLGPWWLVTVRPDIDIGPTSASPT